jgi:hypothetical protein
MIKEIKTELTVIVVGLMLAAAMFVTNTPTKRSYNAIVANPRFAVQFSTGGDYQPIPSYSSSGGWGWQTFTGLLGGYFGSVFGALMGGSTGNVGSVVK